MSTSKNPQAFPQPAYQSGNQTVPGVPGMTLRDWFAGQALAGFCAAPDLKDNTHVAIAIGAYLQADAMLAARQWDPAS